MEPNSILEQLKAEHTRLQSVSKELKKKLDQTEREREAVAEALDALRRSSRQKQGRPAKPAPSRDVVSAIVTELRKKHQGLSLDELEKLTEKAVVQRGFSRMGLKLRMKEVCSKAEVHPASAQVNTPKNAN